MKDPRDYVCPRCNYQLVPVHAVEDERRRIIALTCPEPYCDHMQLITRSEAEHLERLRVSGTLGEALRSAR
jgi:hypothetical protein